MESRFTVPEKTNQYPQAKFHTQWPGIGVANDETFDQFFASQGEDSLDLTLMEQLNRDAGIALLERIGPVCPAHTLTVRAVRLVNRRRTTTTRQGNSSDRAKRSAVL